MKYKFMTVSLLIGSLAFGQQRGRSLFLETGGPANLSLNYDQRFSKSPAGFGARAGVGWYAFNTPEHEVRGISLPVELNYFISLKSRLLTELGYGMVYRNIDYSSKASPVKQGTSEIVEYIDLALRLVSRSERFFCRAAYTPVFNGMKISETGGQYAFTRSRFGVSLGVCLSKGRRDENGGDH